MKRNAYSGTVALLVIATALPGLQSAAKGQDRKVPQQLREMLADESLDVAQRRERIISLSGGLSEGYAKALLDKEGIEAAVEVLREGPPELAEEMVRWMLFSLECNRYAVEDLVYPIVEDPSVPIRQRLAILGASVLAPPPAPHRNHVLFRQFLSGPRADAVRLALLKPDEDEEQLLLALGSRAILGNLACRRFVPKLLEHRNAQVQNVVLESIHKGIAVAGDIETAESVLATVRIMAEEAFSRPSKGIHRVADAHLTALTGLKCPAHMAPDQFWPAWWEEEGRKLFLSPNSKALQDARRRSMQNGWISPALVDRLMELLASGGVESRAGVEKAIKRIVGHSLCPEKGVPPDQFWPKWWQTERPVYVSMIDYYVKTPLDANASTEERQKAIRALAIQTGWEFSEVACARFMDAIWNVLDCPTANRDVKQTAAWSFVREHRRPTVDEQKRRRLVQMALPSLTGQDAEYSKTWALECLGRLGRPGENDEVKAAMHDTFRNAAEPSKVRAKAAEELTNALQRECDKAFLLEIVAFGREHEPWRERSSAHTPDQRAHCDSYWTVHRSLRYATGRMFTRDWSMNDWEQYVNKLPDK